MTPDITVEIVPRPEDRSSRSAKYSVIRKGLLSAKPGECVRVALETFRSNPVAYLKPIQFTTRKFHARRMPDGWYLWLDPEPNGNGAKEGGA